MTDLLHDTDTVGYTGRNEALNYEAEYRGQLGDLKGLEAQAADNARFLATHQAAPTATNGRLGQSSQQFLEALIAEIRSDSGTARRLAAEAAARLPADDRKSLLLQGMVSPYRMDELAARMAYAMKDFPAAERAYDDARREIRLAGADPITEREVQRLAALGALSHARQGRSAEAAAAMLPVVAYERGNAAKNRSDRWVPYELALALYVQAVADPARATANLAEAQRLVEGLTPLVRATREPRQLRAWIRQARSR